MPKMHVSGAPVLPDAILVHSTEEKLPVKFPEGVPGSSAARAENLGRRFVGSRKSRVTAWRGIFYERQFQPPSTVDR